MTPRKKEDFLAVQDGFTGSDLNARAKELLERRLIEDDTLNTEEIQRISELSTQLFPSGFELNKEQSNSLRALTKLSQLELKPAREIRSHRPIVGPLIVMLKRLSWPLVAVHLKDHFAAIQEFASWSVDTIARQQVEIETLKNTQQKPSQN